MSKTLASVAGKVARNPLVFPSDQQIEGIAKDLKLENDQKQALRYAIGSIMAFGEQITELEATRLSSPEHLKRMKGIERALFRLRYEVERNRDVMDDIIPMDVKRFLSRSLTFTAISKAISENMFPDDRHLVRVIDTAKSEGRLTVQALEADIRRRHRRSSFEYSHVLFREIVKNLHEPYQEWVELQRHNKGGLHPEWKRALILDQLITASDAIIGKRATSTYGGKFADLCYAVLPVFGQSTTGLNKAIAGALRRK